MFIIDSKLYNQRKRLADRTYNSKFCKETYHSPYENVLKNCGYIHIKSNMRFVNGFENVFNFYKSVYREGCDYKNFAINVFVNSICNHYKGVSNRLDKIELYGSTYSFNKSTLMFE